MKLLNYCLIVIFINSPLSASESDNNQSFKLNHHVKKEFNNWLDKSVREKLKFENAIRDALEMVQSVFTEFDVNEEILLEEISSDLYELIKKNNPFEDTNLNIIEKEEILSDYFRNLSLIVGTYFEALKKESIEKYEKFISKWIVEYAKLDYEKMQKLITEVSTAYKIYNNHRFNNMPGTCVVIISQYIDMRKAGNKLYEFVKNLNQFEFACFVDLYEELVYQYFNIPLEK